MLFERFLKKRRPGNDTPKSTKAPRSVAKIPDQKTLADLACHHADAAQRGDAIRHLTDLTLLRQRGTDDPEPRVRTQAAERYRTLLLKGAGDDLPAPTGETLAAEIGQLQDHDLIEEIARASALPEARRAAIIRCDSVELLTHCALQDGLAANRNLAVERIDDKAALERIAREIGKRDKNVYRTAREKLRTIAEREALPERLRAQCKELCDKAAQLGHLNNWTQDRALLEHLDQQWAEIRDNAEPEWQERYQSARARFLDACQKQAEQDAAQRAAARAQDELTAHHEGLIEELALLPVIEDEAQLRARLEELDRDWQALAPLPEAQQRSFDQRYRKLQQAAAAALERFHVHEKDEKRLGKLITRATQLLDEPKPISLKQAQSLLDDGRALAEAAADSEPAQDFLALAERLDSRVKNQLKHAEQRLRQMPQRMQDLEEHLQSGELKKADPLYQSLQAGLELIQASGLTNDDTRKCAEHLRTLAPQMRELQHWRRWGADQQRENLCAEMESLINQDLPLATLTEQLHTLQRNWKELDASGVRASQPLWERFHTAAETVYTRCQPFLEEQAQERTENQRQREAVCTQLEDFLTRVDWERVDWKKVLRAERDMRRSWNAIGPVEGKQRRALDRRFHQSIKKLDKRLDAERARNQELKRDLIARVNACVELPELDAAIARTKELQREWHTTVPARQKEENQLWQEFRNACDAVFARRNAQQEAQTNELMTNLAQREALCTEASEAVAKESDPEQLAFLLQDLRRRWADAQSLPVPRNRMNGLMHQWQESQQRLEQHWHARADAQRWETMELLRQQTTLCDQVAQSACTESDGSFTAESARTRWSQLATHTDGELQQAILTRFEQTVEALENPKKAGELKERQRDNLEHRTRLCLELEVLAGVDSPAELSQQRLEFQVSRLAERMGEGEADPLRDTAELLREWFLATPCEPAPSLETRFERILRALAPAGKAPASNKTPANA